MKEKKVSHWKKEEDILSCKTYMCWKICPVDMTWDYPGNGRRFLFCALPVENDPRWLITCPIADGLDGVDVPRIISKIYFR